MKGILKYLQQTVVALVIASASVGIVFAAPSFDVSTLVSGFLRKINNGHDDPLSTHPGQVFYYGYGFSGNLQEWGYGYGYNEYHGLENDIDPQLTAEYGFDGDDGSPTVDVNPSQNSVIITFSTSYLAKVIYRIGPTYPMGPGNVIENNIESDFNSGERVWEVPGLACGTTYYYLIRAQDAGDNFWSINTSFETDECDGNQEAKKVVGITGAANTRNPSATNHNPRGLRLPPITLRLGSFGQDVKDLQVILNFFGTFLASTGAGSPYNETETFGQKTFNALKKFQSTFGLNKVDGIYGQETYDVMESFLK